MVFRKFHDSTALTERRYRTLAAFGERENRSPLWLHIRRRDFLDDRLIKRNRPPAVPSLGGEGQGEGGREPIITGKKTFRRGGQTFRGRGETFLTGLQTFPTASGTSPPPSQTFPTPKETFPGRNQTSHGRNATFPTGKGTFPPPVQTFPTRKMSFPFQHISFRNRLGFSALAFFGS